MYRHACETQKTKHRRIADKHVRIVTSKMSCAQKTRESCERLSPKKFAYVYGVLEAEEVGLIGRKL